MLAAQRKELLLDRLHADGRLVAKDLAIELDTSEDTIRRDLRELAAAGLCHRVYGGAIPVAPAAASYAHRQQLATSSKQRVAAACLQLIEPGSTLILDGGTTALEVARVLPRDPELTVITHSPTIAVALVDHPAEVFVLGGRLFKHSVVTSGAATAEAAALVSADLFLLGVTGVRPDTGLTTGDADEAAMKRTLSRRASQTWVMASEEKIGAASPFPVLGLDEVTGIVSDADHAHPVLTELESAGVRVLRA
ncbi:DeoR/GlpR family DNA-binding transcription regulator [Cellulomonas sp. Root137]|uniref:DeoR/GlpR family DNA-binding transcription regulator n=1 Tax=Cellulomonas sp. Root137 TaxID=1736459 RepID=UPI0006F75757|nr:DeoR/GlpR family DNA-binding transcription regulator [Cellulomonas sp. Root137]KQY47620.1 DeoR family transcriptional regulator [Cellulomonas sp. Root137]